VREGQRAKAFHIGQEGSFTLHAVSSGMTTSRDTTAIFKLAGQPVGTRSEDWRIETEARAILKMPKRDRRGPRPQGCRGDHGDDASAAGGTRCPECNQFALMLGRLTRRLEDLGYE